MKTIQCLSYICCLFQLICTRVYVFDLYKWYSIELMTGKYVDLPVTVFLNL